MAKRFRSAAIWQAVLAALDAINYRSRSSLRRAARRNARMMEGLEPRTLFSVPSNWQATPPLMFGSGLLSSQPLNTLSLNHPTAPTSSSTPTAGPAFQLGSTTPFGLTPAQIRGAYDMGQYGSSTITFGSIQGTGAGQTIAIIDAYDDPTALTDLQGFDAYFGLPNPPSFQKFNQFGQTSPLPPTDPAGPANLSGISDWETEESLDIEWAHVMAPLANIDLFEAPNPGNGLFNSVVAAANTPGVDVVSMSWGGSEFSGETSLDSIFTTPAGHLGGAGTVGGAELQGGITFVTSAGDSGIYARGSQHIQPQYPASSPNVVAVGGTTLTVDGDGYGGETAWGRGNLSGYYGGGGGGISAYEAQPAYQHGVVTQSTTKRTYPDLALDADPASGVPIYDSYDFGSSHPWLFTPIGGTSLSSPMFAGMVAVADQGRALASIGSLDGATQTLPDLYRAPTSDFHDITTGNNGYSAGPGYDLTTGIGSPIGQLVIANLVASSPPPPTIFVDAHAAGADNGSSWANAYTTLEQAITAATGTPSAPIRIDVAQGTYIPSTTGNTSDSFYLKNNVSIYGGYAGDTTSSPGARNVTAYPTILSGALGSGVYSLHVVRGDSTNATALLDGVTIEYGSAEYGGGFFDAFGAPTINNCIFVNNSAFGGGAVFLEDGAAPTFTNDLFHNNLATYGGAMYASDSSPDILGCTFDGDGATANGGAIYNTGSSPIITGSVFTHDTAVNGGAIANGPNSSPIITSDSFTQCTVSGDGGALFNNGSFTYTTPSQTYTCGGAGYDCGGTYYNCGGTTITIPGQTVTVNTNDSPVITNSTFLSDSASGQGGAIYSTYSTMTVLNGTFDGDSAVGGGGAIANQCANGNFSTHSSVTNCAFVQDATAGDGGAILNGTYSYSTVDNSTFTDNSAHAGGAVADNFVSSGTSFIQVNNSILWNNSGGELEASYLGSTAAGGIGVATSDVQGGIPSNPLITAGSGNINADPQFVRNPGTGDYGNLELQIGSPCINAGNNADVPAGVTTDLAGNIRIVGGKVEMGAYESEVLYVDHLATSGLQNGGSWANAFLTVQQALAASTPNSHQIIEVGQGTYVPGTTATSTFQLVNGVLLEGGFAGLGTVNPEAQDLSLYPTILSGSLAGGVHSYHVVNGSGTDSTTELKDFTITGGDASSSVNNQMEGGGIYIYAGSPTIDGCVISGDSASVTYVGDGIYSVGGGVCAISSYSTFTDCTIDGDSAAFGGGGVDLQYGGPTFTNCTVNNDQSDYLGGGVYTRGSIPTFVGCQIDHDVSYYGGLGGGVLNFRFAEPTFISCDISDDQTFGHFAAEGGGISNFSFVAMTLTDCTLDGDSAHNSFGLAFGGAISQFYHDTGAITGCTFDGDSATKGGAIASVQGVVGSVPMAITATDSTFTDDTAAEGGAILNGWFNSIRVYYAGPTTATNCTFAGDSSSGDAGAIASNGEVYLIGCALTDDQAAGNGGALMARGPATLTNCTVSGDQAGTDGGGVYAKYGPFIVTNTTFSTDSASQGGGVFAENANSTFTNTSFTDDSAQLGGGAIADGNLSSIAVSQSSFTGDTATGSATIAGDGGAVENTQTCQFTATNSTFNGNWASGSGGAIANLYATNTGHHAAQVTLVGCLLQDNSAHGQGGAIANENLASASPSTDAGLSTTDCMFNGDSSGATGPGTGALGTTYGGGAIVNYSGAATTTNCTFVGNHVSLGGDGDALLNSGSNGTATVNNSTFTANYGTGGHAIYSTAGTALQVYNSILWADTAEIGSSGSAAVTVNNSDVQGGHAGTLNINQNPKFTTTPNVSVGNFGNLELLPNSPSINTGNNSYVPSGVTTDLAGSPRIVDNIVDMGAYEEAPIYVDYLSTSGLNIGTSWANAFTTLQAGLTAAANVESLYPGAQVAIEIAQGTYYPTTGTSRSATFQLASNVAIYGGYSGLGTANPDARNPALYSTILSGDIGISGNISDNSYHVVTAGTGANSMAVLDGVTVAYGNATGLNGGGLYDTGGSPTINDCTFSNDTASLGGAVYVSSGSPTFANCTFSSDTASIGGAFYAAGGSTTIGASSFTSDSATTGGAAAVESGASVAFDGATFTSDHATANGGAIYIQNASPTVLACAFTSDTAANGGAIAIDINSSPTISLSTFTQCTVSGDGGAIYAQAQHDYGSYTAYGVTNFTLSGSTFDGNQATLNGGAIAATTQENSTLYPDITNCDFVRNIAVDGDGGGVFVGTYTYANIADSSFTQNSAAGGGAVADDFGSSGFSFVEVDNSILWNDGGGELEASFMGDDYAGGILVQHSDVQGGIGSNPLIVGGSGNINLDPKFMTVPTTGNYGNLQLQGTSPAINAGSNSLVPAGTTNDHDGQTRIIGGIVDMGAHECQTVLPIYVDHASTGLNNGTTWADAFTSLQQALASVTAGAIIEVGQGTYVPSSPSGRNATFSLPGGISITGGYAGVGTSNPNAQNAITYPTILSGAGTDYHVVTASSTTAPILLDGFVITGGDANGSGSLSEGGGLYANNTTLTLIDCSFNGNAATNGGGIYQAGSTLNVYNSTFVGNTSSSGGNAVYAASGTSQFSDDTFTQNNSSASGAGAVANHGATLNFVNSILWNDLSNSAASELITSSGATTATYSDVTGGFTGTGNINTDPLFVTVPNPGVGNYGNLALQTGSTAINAGNNASSPSAVTTDLAGNTRIIGGIVDMGAYENQTVATIYVDHLATGYGNGTTWNNAFTTLQAALSAVISGAVIEVGQGTYIPSAPSGRNATFQLASGVAIYGGYSGAGTSNPNARNVATYPTILAGGSLSTISSNDYHVVTASNTNSTAILDGFTISYGNANGGGSANNGGGVYDLNGSPTINNCTFSNDQAVSGGAIFIDGNSSPIFTNCTFNSDSATTGGAIYDSGTALTVNNSTFTSNFATSSAGVLSNNSHNAASLINCLFLNNQVGSISSHAVISNGATATATITNCTFDDNGVAIFNAAASGTTSVHVNNTILWSDAGEIGASSTGTVVVNNSDVDQAGYAGSNNNIDADPHFLAPGSNVQVAVFSPAINAGNNTYVPTGITTDLAGQTRVVGVVDMGVYENQLRTYYVDYNATGSNTGADWTNAFVSVQSALTAAAGATSQVRIEIGQGTYLPTTGADRTATFQLNSNALVIGGYAGLGTANPAALDVTAYPTVLSGNIGSSSSSTDNSYHVVTGGGTGSLLYGLTIANGNANGTLTGANDGGGLYNESTSMTVSNCTFASDSASGQGGAMYNLYSDLTIADCTFDGDSAAEGGGAIANQGNVYATQMTVVNSVFAGNAAIHGDGGAILNGYYAYATVDNCTFNGNSAASGGAIADDFGSSGTSFIQVENSILWSDGSTELEATTGGDGGGGIFVEYSDVQGGVTSTSVIAAGSGNITGDPAFVSAPTNLQIQNSSPCLNAGKNADIPAGITTDLLDNPRILGSRVDMGAYEGQSAIVFVDASAPSGGDGSTWATAFTTLTQALTYVASQHPSSTNVFTIDIGQGTYFPGSSQSATFNLLNEVIIQGGFAGTGTSDPGDQNPAAYPTILSGNIGNAAISSDNSFNVVTAGGKNSTAVLRDVTIAYGNATSGGGGGLNSSGGSPTLQNITFLDNHSANQGGGLYVSSGSPTLTNCVFDGDTAATGGGIFVGAYSSVTVTNSTFVFCSATGDGGAIQTSAASASVTLTGCTLEGDSTSGGQGGAISNNYSALTISHCTFDGDAAHSGGGAIAGHDESGGYYSTASISYSTFVGDSAGSANGGAILSGDYSRITVDHCTFDKNSASAGGAIADDFGSSDGTSYVLVNHSILWSDASNEVEANGNGGGAIVIQNTDIQGGVPSGTFIDDAGGNINSNPLFVRTPNLATADYGDLRLGSGSPASGKGAFPTISTATTVSSFTITRTSGRITSLTIVLSQVSANPIMVLYSPTGGSMPFQISTSDNQTYVLSFPSSLDSAYTSNQLPAGQYGFNIQPTGGVEQYFAFTS